MHSIYSQVIESVFGGDYPHQPFTLCQIVARSTLMFFVGLAIMRLGKSRLMSRATALDVVLGFLLGSLLSRGITGSASMSGTTVSMATLVALHWVLTAITCRWHGLGNIVKGHCEQLVENGQILTQNLRKAHISEHDLLESLRMHVFSDDLSRMKAAYKERSGEIGFVKREPTPKVVEIAVQAGVQTVRIELSA